VFHLRPHPSEYIVRSISGLIHQNIQRVPSQASSIRIYRVFHLRPHPSEYIVRSISGFIHQNIQSVPSQASSIRIYRAFHLIHQNIQSAGHQEDTKVQRGYHVKIPTYLSRDRDINVFVVVELTR
jgi:Mg2+/Co2+ transporter CorB